MFRFKLFILCLLVTISFAKVEKMCKPSMECWPSEQDIYLFKNSLTDPNSLLLPGTTRYNNLKKMKNTRVTKAPAMMVEVLSNDDISKSILFAKKFNIFIAIQSSGHDFQGRSTADGALQIYLGAMKKINVELNTTRDPDGIVTVESGAQWLDVYKEVDKYDRVVVGGSAHTVCIGGYTLGGGHSPMTPMFGLAVDSLLEVEMVTADGDVAISTKNMTKIMHVNGTETIESNGDLLWALSGGGGGTFGIAPRFTFKLHPAAPAVVRFSCAYPVRLADKTNIGSQVLDKYLDMVQRMPREWGGYYLASGLPGEDGRMGSIQLFLNHYGGWDTDSRHFMDEMFNFLPEHQLSCDYTNYSRFLEYEKTAIDALYIPNYISGGLLTSSSFTADLKEFLIERMFSFPLSMSATAFTIILVGGKTNEIDVDATSLSPVWRQARLSLAGSILWDNKDLAYNTQLAAYGVTLGKDIEKFAHGMYRNEASGKIDDYKNQFWGNTHYERLLDIKLKWDPDQIFTCFDCVGNELITRKDVNSSSRSQINCLVIFVIIVLAIFF